jgi:hypothetical protein
VRGVTCNPSNTIEHALAGEKTDDREDARRDHQARLHVELRSAGEGREDRQDSKTGKTRPRWVGGFSTRTAAKAARDGARNAVNQDIYVAPQDVTVGAYLDRWIEAHSVELKPSTVWSYRAKIDLYLKPAIGSERVQELNPSGLSVKWKQLYEHGGKDGKPVSVRTLEFARAVLRRAMADAVLDRVITVNPVIGSKLPKRDGKAATHNVERRTAPTVPGARRRQPLASVMAAPCPDRHEARRGVRAALGGY